MKNCWKMRAFGLVAVVMGVVLLGAVSPVCAGTFPGDGVDLPLLSYQDNGDGTITDLNTRLIWEQKLAMTNPAFSGATRETRNVHCVDNTYTWNEAFTVFLDVLNNKCDGDGTTLCTRAKDCKNIGSGKCGLDGHRDWSIPNIKELQSIVDYGTRAPAIDSTFPGAKAVSRGVLPYCWSSTAQFEFSSMAFFVDFDYGTVSVHDINTQYCVRAVRGGQ